MNTKTNLYQINGYSMLTPDEDLEMSFEDVDASNAGRDEAGFMHRAVVRRKVGVWNFVYSHLTAQEYAYMISIMPTGGTFTFTYPNPAGGSPLHVTAYLSRYGVVWHSARTGLYRNLKFSIIQC